MNKGNLEVIISDYMAKHKFLVQGVLGTKPAPKYHAEEMLREILITFQQVLAVGGKIHIPELGTLSVKEVKARQAHNPKTGEKVHVPKHKRVAFKAGKQLREIVNTK